MKKKSPYELAIVALTIKMRLELKRTQSYIAMILGVSDGYIGQIESPKYGSMYTHDQLNTLAQDFNCSPRDFIPEEPVEQELPKRNN